VSDAPDSLLHVVTARRRMAWRDYIEVIDVLAGQRLLAAAEAQKASPSHLRRQLVHAMSDLAHCDYAFDDASGSVMVAPPVLARLPQAGLPRAVLCGARCPGTVSSAIRVCRELGHAVKCTIQHQPACRILVPDRIVLHAETSGLLQQVAERLGAVYAEEPPAWSLLYCTPAIGEYIGSLTWREEREINWRRREFDVQTLTFGHEGVARAGLVLHEYTDAARRSRIHYLRSDAQAARCDRDWGRWVILDSQKVEPIVYDCHRKVLAVPLTVRLPRLLARVLSLCSGYAPFVLRCPGVPPTGSRSDDWLAYPCVPQMIAERIAEKLDQRVLPATVPQLSVEE
jgi:hypothetical protein